MNTPPRYHAHTRSFLATVAVAIPALLIGASLSAPAEAAFIATLEEVGTSVVATGSGTFDLTGLTAGGTSPGTAAFIVPSTASMLIGPTSAEPITLYSSIDGPTSFGPSNFIAFVSSGSGNPVDIVGVGTPVTSHALFLPQGYVSGNMLSDTATYNNASFNSLGVTPGTYEWTWGSGTHADSYTLQIGPAAVPAPLIGRGLPALLAIGGLLFGAKLLERGKRRRLQFG